MEKNFYCLENVLKYRKLAKKDPLFIVNYKDIKRSYTRSLKIVKAWMKTKWFLSQIFGVTCVDSDGDCDGTSESYAFRFFFWECYLGSTFTRSRTAPPDVPHTSSHELSWELKDLFSKEYWRKNSMFIEK